MTKLITSLVLLVLLSASGCSNSDSKTQSTESKSTTDIPLPVDTNTNKIQSLPTTIPPTVLTTKPESTAGLNPAHGQPGHRCEISVGAPLDNKTGQTPGQNPAAITATPIIATTTSAPSPSNSLNITPQPGKGLNPAHGQPGHRCEIAVGAPLDSKPVQAAIQTPSSNTSSTPKATSPSAPVITPVTLPATSPLSKPSAANGINPAHGQPGHRCDISVGAPLNNKPAQ